MNSQTTKWILAAGTGKYELPENVYWVSREMGRMIASRGFGLVVGGWQGVDYVVAQAFADELKHQKKALSAYLIQVVPQGKNPVFRGGHVIFVERGMKEWTESVRYADAVVLIGGLGGTYETYQFAMQEQKPVWPVAATEGDARKAYTDLLEHWDLQPIEAISKNRFGDNLNAPVHSQEDARQVSSQLLELITQSFRQQEKKLEASRSRIFISYSHQDRQWLSRLRLMLKPLERQKGFYVWDDTSIEAGQKWKEEITNALDSTKVAVFLVSPGFVASDFITNHELPPLLEAADQGHVTILWVYVSACLYEITNLHHFQAAHDVSSPLDLLNPAEQNEVLVGVAKKIEKAVEQPRHHS